MKTSALILILALAQGAALNAWAHTVLLPEHSEITFVFKQMGSPVTGRFTRFDAQLALNLAQPETGSVIFTVDTTSATLGLPDIDAELAKPQWLASGQFPQATFSTRRIRVTATTQGTNQLEVSGMLSIKGLTQELTLPLALETAADITTASGSVILKRMDFQVGQGDWADPSLVADEVQVNFRLALKDQ